MSNIYIQEPPTHGKVLLVTSCGDIDIELWSKETPKACRNFVQLCMEGYYDGTIFHRVVKDFIVQGGDPSGTGEGGDSIYGHPFKDEIHSRLRFARRGLVAMANAGANDNGSQFFFTLGPAPELNKKHTIFGKIPGNTVFNMLKLADVELHGDRPVNPYKIVRTEILANPFDDIIPRVLPKSIAGEKEVKKKKSRSKATKNFNLLSFGEEAEEDEVETDTVTKEMKGKSKSSHDLTDDPHLSSVPAVDIPEASVKRESASDESEDSDTEMKERIRKKLKKSEPEEPPEQKEKNIKPSKNEELRREVQQLKKELLEAKKRKEQKDKGEDEEKPEADPEPENEAVALFKNERKKYKEQQKKMPKKGSEREAQTLALLAKFKTKLEAAQEKAEQNGEEEKAEGDDWLGHKLEFESSQKKVLDANVQDGERYEIYDPRNPLNKRRRENSKQASKDKKR